MDAISEIMDGRWESKRGRVAQWHCASAQGLVHGELIPCNMTRSDAPRLTRPIARPHGDTGGNRRLT